MPKRQQRKNHTFADMAQRVVFCVLDLCFFACILKCISCLVLTVNWNMFVLRAPCSMQYALIVRSVENVSFTVSAGISSLKHLNFKCNFFILCIHT